MKNREMLIRILTRNLRDVDVSKREIESLASRVVASDDPMSVLREFARNHNLP